MIRELKLLLVEPSHSYSHCKSVQLHNFTAKEAVLQTSLLVPDQLFKQTAVTQNSTEIHFPSVITTQVISKASSGIWWNHMAN